MRELTAAYTAFPNLGVRVEPYLLRQVTDHRGKVLYDHQPETKRVVAADAAYVMHSLLRGVVQRGTASRLKRWGLGYVAGKTGHTNDYRDAWFVGYTPDMVTTVWVGFDHGAPLRLSSAEAAIPIWAGVHERDFPSSKRAAATRGRDVSRHRPRYVDALAGRLSRSLPGGLSRRHGADPLVSAGIARRDRSPCLFRSGELRRAAGNHLRAVSPMVRRSRSRATAGGGGSGSLEEDRKFD